jgi:hypothetical protein
MSVNFCTYFDKNYLSKFLVLKDSIDKFNSQCNFFVLALDDFVINFFRKNKIKNIKLISLKDLEQEYKDLIIAKNNRDLIEYYFTLSPFLPRYIFKKFKCNYFSYVDSDFFFLKDPVKLFLQNESSSITLIKQESHAKYGLFNVGLIFFNFNFSETLEIINTWSEQCLSSCNDIPDTKKNIYADQKYLDHWIIKLKNIKILYPEHSVLSPWDSNRSIENNIDYIYAFHFHALEINDIFFNTGFSNYNKRPSKIILDKLYYPYTKKILALNTKYNLVNKSIRNFSNKNFKKKLRKLKLIIKKFLYRDYYKLN